MLSLFVFVLRSDDERIIQLAVFHFQLSSKTGQDTSQEAHSLPGVSILSVRGVVSKSVFIETG